jgi:hypothetical protein
MRLANPFMDVTHLGRLSQQLQQAMLSLVSHTGSKNGSDHGAPRLMDEASVGGIGDSRLNDFWLLRRRALSPELESRAGIRIPRMPSSAAAKAAEAFPGDAYVMRQWPNGRVS